MTAMWYTNARSCQRQWEMVVKGLRHVISIQLYLYMCLMHFICFTFYGVKGNGCLVSGVILISVTVSDDTCFFVNM